MITIDSGLKTAIDSGETEYPLIVCTNATGGSKVFTNANIWNGKFSVDRYIANGNTPEIGSAITAECSFSLRYNSSFPNWLSGKDICLFAGCKSHWDYSTIAPDIAGTLAAFNTLIDSLTIGQTKTILYCGENGAYASTSYINGNISGRAYYGKVYTVSLSSNISASITESAPLCPLGVFYADTIKTTKNSIDVVGLDYLSKLDLPYNGTGTTMSGMYYKLANIISKVADNCNVRINAPATVDIENIIFMGLPETGSCTYRNILQYAGQLSGYCCYCRPDGKKVIDFVKYNSSAINPAIDVTASKRYSMAVNSNADLTMNGLVLSAGSSDYLGSGGNTTGLYFSVTGNKLANTYGKIRHGYQSLANNAWANISTGIDKITYRPFEAEIIQTPYLNLYDFAKVYDANDAVVTTPITHISYDLNSPMTIKCAGDSNTLASTMYAQTAAASNDAQAVVENALRRNALLSGVLWSSGTKTINGIDNYSLYIITVKDASNIYRNIICRKDCTTSSATVETSITGDARTYDSSTINSYYIKLSFTSSNVVSIEYASRGISSAYTALTIVNIYGII